MTSFKTRIDLGSETCEKSVALLNQLLADAFDLFSQTKQAHWNVRGPNFIALHKLFDDLAEVVEGSIDEIAERAAALGGEARGTARMAAQASRLPEYPEDLANGMAHVQALADRFAMVAKQTRIGIDQTTNWNDVGTADLLTGIVRELDKGLWFLEAHVQSA